MESERRNLEADILRIVVDVLGEPDEDEGAWEGGEANRPLGERVDSICAVQFKARLEAETGVTVPISMIVPGATAGQLADYCLMSERVPALYLPFRGDGGRKPFLSKTFRAFSKPSQWLNSPKSGIKTEDGRRPFMTKAVKGKVLVYKVAPRHPQDVRERVPITIMDEMMSMLPMSSSYLIRHDMEVEVLCKALSTTLDAFPALAGTMVQEGGRLLLEWGGGQDAVKVEVPTGPPTDCEGDPNHGGPPPTPRGPTSPPQVVLMSAANRKAAARAMFARSALTAYSTMLQQPLLRVFIRKVNITGGVATLLQIKWNHVAMDGHTVDRFITSWAAASRGEPLVMPRPGPGLSPEEHARLSKLFMSESGVSFSKILKGKSGFGATRFRVTAPMLEAWRAGAGGCSRLPDTALVTALLWKEMAESYSMDLNDPSRVPPVVFLENLRRHVPALETTSGNMLRWSPLATPEVPARGPGPSAGNPFDDPPADREAYFIAGVAEAINEMRRGVDLSLEALLAGAGHPINMAMGAPQGVVPVLGVNDTSAFTGQGLVFDATQPESTREALLWAERGEFTDASLPHYSRDLIASMHSTGSTWWYACLAVAPEGRAGGILVTLIAT